MNNLNDILLCKAIKEHIEEIFNINKLSFLAPWSIQSIEKEILSNPHALYIVAIKDNKILGYGGLWIILDEGHVTNIAIHPNYRQLGIASLVLSTLIKESKNRGVNSITLEVRKSNSVAQNLYQKFGFVEEGCRKHYYSDNLEDAIIMWKHDI
ncbi:ribosomal-protein-alanine acetyltransferase [Clostridium tetani]|uniref:[Ribosomal protein bS18]-alanine N-acetyltransferase n=1 Tax=Clostridium tetani TaxID=1513 RepID=A0A4Q0VDJ9_CLOTA|nr:ribosomal protein S18-alanine N-acetyltransferase [Clostridium tetani]RXI48282.1 ribosomal-protein-alanine N-acetyltransferase [Clostridium tetani]BDR68182.1 ribosomal-protein-alanine acetyltransferase [Clostridium tetani]BDR73740.1 ribosomal-protein-alanine acetyltransferase [Clostridium tetani]BDR82112.1 ribosomal-protein-alanine acetyltransferase [Clostridium tetani]BDR90502.1 ribosomal-protein-alanine acetyltransferase [Clostridium tetani]